MLHVIFILLGVVLLGVGTYTDFRWREVPDWVNYGVLFSAGLLRITFAVVEQNIDFIISGLLGFSLFFIIAMSMFYLGQWGGGDAKIMMALGTLLGFEFSAHYFSVAFLVNIILVGAMYGIAWSCYIATQHWAKFLKTSKRLLKDKTYFLLKILSAGIAVVLISISFFVQYSHQKTGLIILGAGIFLFFYLYIFVKAIEECCMFKLVKPTKLSEGDWIAEKITYKNRIIAQPKDLGIGQRQINKLVKLYEQGKIRRVKIKEGMPFVPNFFLAYVVTFFWGNVILSLI